MRYLLLVTLAAFNALNSSAHANEQFRYIFHDALTRDRASSIISHLEENYLSVMSNLGVTELPTVTVHLWTNYENLYVAQYERTGQRFEGSSGLPWWDAVDGPEILIVYDERYEGRRQHTIGLLHEFAHIVTIEVNPSIPNNPRWLWESVALYQAGDRRDLSRLEYIVTGDYPTIAELDVGYNQASETRDIYQVGYSIAEYIVENWGQEGLNSLLQTNGDTLNSLGISSSEFESGWYAFVEDRYL